MSGKISRQARREVLDAMRCRYRDATKASKSRILDEVVALTGCHRKHAVRLMSTLTSQASPKVGQRVYDEATREALTVLWEAADRICSKRLKAIIPSLVSSMETHGHLQFSDEVRKLVLAVSPATIDRLLAPMRTQATKRKKRRRAKKASKRVSVRTFADWGDPKPGSLEIDFVNHCGGSMKGSYIHSLVATDVCSGWTNLFRCLCANSRSWSKD